MFYSAMITLLSGVHLFRSLQEQEQAGDGAAGTKGLAAAPSGHSPAEQALAAHTKQHAGERLGKLVAHRDVRVSSEASCVAFVQWLGWRHADCHPWCV